MSNDTSSIKEIRLKKLTPRHPPFKVTQSLRKRHGSTATGATCDFLLTFHSSHVPISYSFRVKRRFQAKTADFCNPGVLKVPAEGFPLKLGTGASLYRAEKYFRAVRFGPSMSTDPDALQCLQGRCEYRHCACMNMPYS